MLNKKGKINNLYVGSGRKRGASIMHSMKINGLLNNIKSIHGSSIGSLIAFMYCLNFDIKY